MKALQLTLVAPLLAVSLLLVATTSQAGALPDYYPKTFDTIGTLDGLDISSRSLTIDDRSKRLDPNIKVHTQSSQFSSLDVLRPGMTVGISLSGKTITGIWVLPKDYKPAISR